MLNVSVRPKVSVGYVTAADVLTLTEDTCSPFSSYILMYVSLVGLVNCILYTMKLMFIMTLSILEG